MTYLNITRQETNQNFCLECGHCIYGRETRVINKREGILIYRNKRLKYKPLGT